MTDLHRTSYSELTSHRTCPQKWNYGYHRGLEKDDPGDVPVGRDFGSWWHALRAADALERGRALGSLQVAPRSVKTVDGGPRWTGEDVTWSGVLAAAELWWRNRPAETQEQWIELLGEGLPDRLGALWERWTARWDEDIAAELPLAVELRWVRRLPVVDKATDHPRDPLTELVGHVDEVYLDRKRGLVVVRDNKTGHDLSSQTSADDMMDSQLQLYAWGITPLVQTWGVGRVGAVGYERVRSVAPHPPQLTKSGRLAVRNGEPSIGQCDLHTYLLWAKGEDGAGVPYEGLKKDGSAAGFYQAEASVIEKLSTPAAASIWFQRTLTPLNINLVRTHLRSAVDSALDLQASQQRVARTGEAARNLTSRCRYCEFAKLCRAEMIGGPTKDDEVVYELSDYRLRQRPARSHS